MIRRALFWLVFGYVLYIGGLGCAAKTAPSVTPANPDGPLVWLWIDPYDAMVQRYSHVCWQEGVNAPQMKCFAMGVLLDALEQFGDRHPGFHPDGLPAGDEVRR